MGTARLSCKVILLALGGLLLAQSGSADHSAEKENWIGLFNGHDLDDWTVKITQHPVGVNFANTYRVVDGMITVVYDDYDDFDNQFGHMFYNEPFSHYRLRLEYRFIGEAAPNAPEWAVRNSGAMLHSQAPETMPPEQNFPISLEFQFLGGVGDGSERATGNMCSPGTNVVYNGKFDDTHCINSTSATFHGEQWVKAEALVLGSEKIVHYIDGKAVMEFTDMTYGGGAVAGHRPELILEGEPIGSGYISLQSESHPIQFRNIKLLNLKGCMDPDASNYKTYFVAPDPENCKY